MRPKRVFQQAHGQIQYLKSSEVKLEARVLQALEMGPNLRGLMRPLRQPRNISKSSPFKRRGSKAARLRYQIKFVSTTHHDIDESPHSPKLDPIKGKSQLQSF